MPLQAGLSSFCPVIIPIRKAPSGESGRSNLYSGLSINAMGKEILSCQFVLEILNPQFFPWPIRSIALAAFISDLHFPGSLGTFISTSKPQGSTLPSGKMGHPKGTVNLMVMFSLGWSLLMFTFVEVTYIWETFSYFNTKFVCILYHHQ